MYLDESLGKSSGFDVDDIDVIVLKDGHGGGWVDMLVGWFRIIGIDVVKEVLIGGNGVARAVWVGWVHTR